ncbi:MAG: DUF2795 domain-containing protein [Catenulisporales bacterium]|jgi:hypothetical protein|nr:DUF2795 domain-containing protein [Catenulisporales bacterium]
MTTAPNPIEMQKHLSGVDYPADRETLLRTARENGADDDLVRQLEQLPDRQYSGPDEVTEALFRS